MKLAVKFRSSPSHNGPLSPAIGADGVGLTTTVVVPAGPVQIPSVAVTLYTPSAARVTLVMVGFWLEELKLLGPVQL